MHRSLDSRSFGKPQSVFIYGKTSLEKIASKTWRERAHFFFSFLFFFWIVFRFLHSRRGKSMSRRVQQSQIFQKKRGKTSSFSRERHAFQIPQFITATPHDLNKLTHTATFLFESTSSTSYAKLLHY